MRSSLIVLVIVAGVVIVFAVANYLLGQIVPLPVSAPEDFAVVEATILSAKGINVSIQVDKILEYRRDPKVTWEQLKENDQISISVAVAEVVPREYPPSKMICTNINETTVCYYENHPAATINVTRSFGKEYISNFVSSLVGKKVVVSMNRIDSINNYDSWEGVVNEIL